MLKNEKWLFVFGVVLILFITAFVLYSLIFLSSQMFNAFAPSEEVEDVVIFDSEGFRELDL